MNTSAAPPAKSSQGFTLLELMVAVTLLGVLLGIGIPSFNETIRNNRTVAQTNEFITALNLARSEASKRGLPVAICAANAAQTACASATANNWTNGWLVFTDQGATVGAIDAGEPILQTSRAVTPGLQLTSSNVGFLQFGASGSANTTATFGIQHSGCTGNNRRRIEIVPTGRANLSKVACT
jgi:type IV fimbrial biogenesis protein FimT